MEPGSSATFPSSAALAAAAFLVSAALAASFAAAAASSFDFASALVLLSCAPASAALAAAFCFSSSARALAWSVFAAASAIRERELCVGAGLEPFQPSQRRRERCCLACRCRGGFLRLVGRFGGLRGLASERLGTRRSSRDGLGVRHE